MAAKLTAWLSISSGIILVVFALVALLVQNIFLSELIWIKIIPFSQDISTSIILSLMSGTIIILTSIFMFVKPRRTRTLGIVILVFSIIACFGMGIFTIGGIIGITGGVFAIIGEKRK